VPDAALNTVVGRTVAKGVYAGDAAGRADVGRDALVVAIVTQDSAPRDIVAAGCPAPSFKQPG